MSGRSSPVLVRLSLFVIAAALLAQALRHDSDWQTWTATGAGWIACALLAWGVFIRRE